MPGNDWKDDEQLLLLDEKYFTNTAKMGHSFVDFSLRLRLISWSPRRRGNTSDRNVPLPGLSH